MMNEVIDFLATVLPCAGMAVILTFLVFLDSMPSDFVTLAKDISQRLMGAEVQNRPAAARQK